MDLLCSYTQFGFLIFLCRHTLKTLISLIFIIKFFHLIFKFVSKILVSFYSALRLPNCVSVFRHHNAPLFLRRRSFHQSYLLTFLRVRAPNPPHQANAPRSPLTRVRRGRGSLGPPVGERWPPGHGWGSHTGFGRSSG